MTTQNQTEASTKFIPLNRLKLSPRNARKTPHLHAHQVKLRGASATSIIVHVRFMHFLARPITRDKTFGCRRARHVE